MKCMQSLVNMYIFVDYHIDTVRFTSMNPKLHKTEVAGFLAALLSIINVYCDTNLKLL